jgi:hypothetical protein
MGSVDSNSIIYVKKMQRRNLNKKKGAYTTSCRISNFSLFSIPQNTGENIDNFCFPPSPFEIGLC